jgi:hypothetical protein
MPTWADGDEPDRADGVHDTGWHTDVRGVPVTVGPDSGDRADDTGGLSAALRAERRARPASVRVSRRPRVRKVSRVVRSIDAWSVFKVSLVFYLTLYVVCLVAGVLLWNVAYNTGTIKNVTSFFESFGWKSFSFKGGQIYHNVWIIGLLVVILLTGLNVVLATFYNLITDLVGGIRVTVLEEEVLVRPVGTEPAAVAPRRALLQPRRRSG